MAGPFIVVGIGFLSLSQPEHSACGAVGQPVCNLWRHPSSGITKCKNLVKPDAGAANRFKMPPCSTIIK
jgi:hypothetical protein